MDILWLIFAHFLADFPLQGQWLAEWKGKEPLFMLAHVSIWTGMICLACKLLGVDISTWNFLFLFIGHYLADEFKCRAVVDVKNKCVGHDKICNQCIRLLVYLDQIFHLVQILCVYYF